LVNAYNGRQERKALDNIGLLCQSGTIKKVRNGAIILGMRRSGSTLAFNLVRELVARELERGALRTTYADGDAADRFVETARLADSAFVLKTHASGTRVDALITAGHVAAIYTWRDPRDAIVSSMNFLKSTFTEAMNMVTTSLYKFEQNWKGYCLEIAYPELYPLTSTLIYKVARHLNISCSDELSNRLVDEYCLEAMHEFTRRAVNFEDEFDFRYLDRKISRTQLWHEAHVQNGGNELWKQYLTGNQLQILERSWLSKYFIDHIYDGIAFEEARSLSGCTSSST
jgi:hypothetical protein